MTYTPEIIKTHYNCKWYRLGAMDEGDWCAHPEMGCDMLPDEVCEAWEEKNG